ncbi:site-2 protease family protein [soil metagenome]
MSWSLKLGRIAGIPIYVHWTFFILLGFIGFVYFARSGGDLGQVALGLGLILAIFGCVVLHELGHALMARRFGVPTADITLLPIGGVARLQRIPEAPGQELLIAVAGPAVNVLIAGVLLLLGARTPVLFPLVTDVGSAVDFLNFLLFINIFLVLFNLLPAFPMDGGRILRALLAMRLPYTRATRIAASVGQFMAIVFGFFGLLFNPLLLLIALFVWIGAEAEARQVEERVSLGDARVHQAMLTDFHRLSPDDTLGFVAELLLSGSQQDFPVLDGDGHVLGVLSRSGLMQGLSQAGREGRVGDFVATPLGTVSAQEPIVPALARLREGEGPCLLVVDRGEPIGLLTVENIGEFLMVRTALGGTQTRAEQKELASTFEQ